jgi:hypothetical protein
MDQTIIVERRKSGALVIFRYHKGSTIPVEFEGNDEQLHTQLVTWGYKRVSSTGAIEGTYVRFKHD